MRKSSKIILTLIAIFFSLGLVLVLVGFMCGGRFKSVSITGKDYNYISIDETFENKTIDSLEIDIDAGSITIEEGDTFHLEGTNVIEYSLQTGVKGSTLYIKENEPKWYDYIGVFFHTKKEKLTLTVPKGFVAKSADLEVDAGALHVDSLSAKSLKIDVSAGSASLRNINVEKNTLIDVGAGSVTVDTLNTDTLQFDVSGGSSTLNNITAVSEGKISLNAGSIEGRNYTGSIEGRNYTGSNVDIEVDAGSCSLAGTFTKRVNLDVDAGSIELASSLTDDQYHYELEPDVGSIEVNGKSYKEYNNRNEAAENTIKADCSVGSIDIETR